MLLKFGLKNFTSFNEGVEISFELDANVPASIAGGREYATIMCVKGANGSGKTHLLKGLTFIGYFASRSFSADTESEIPVDPYFFSVEPSEFYVEFSHNGVDYLYELSVTKHNVVREALFQTKQRKTKIFVRDGQSVDIVKRLSAIESIELRKNASLISTARQHRVEELLGPYEFFAGILSNVTQAGFTKTPHSEINFVSKFYLDNPDYFEQAKDFIRGCDVGVSDVILYSEKSVDGTENYFPVFHHTIGDIHELVYPSTESSGTLYLYRTLAAYLYCLAKGQVFIADEFDIYLHPHILPKILDLFLGETNDKGAQLLFSTHNSDVLDLCGRYRTYLVNKENNASYAYRLDEVPGDILRNDRSIIPPYNEGRIGGVPRL